MVVTLDDAYRITEMKRCYGEPDLPVPRDSFSARHYRLQRAKERSKGREPGILEKRLTPRINLLK